MERDELSGWLRLTLTPGVGNATARKLYDQVATATPFIKYRR